MHAISHNNFQKSIKLKNYPETEAMHYELQPSKISQNACHFREKKLQRIYEIKP